MAMGYRPGLVDLKTGQISREIFVNEAIYAGWARRRASWAATAPARCMCF